MRVAISVVGADFFEASTGMVVKAKRLFSLLSQRYEVTLIARSNKSSEDRHIIIIRPSGTKLWSLKLIPIILRNRFDCIYCCNDLFGFLSFYVLKPLFKYRIIFDAMSIYSKKRKLERAFFSRVIASRLYRLLENFVIWRAHYVVCEAEYVATHFRKYNQNISVVPLFVDEEIFRRAEVKKEGSKESRTVGIIGPLDSPAGREYMGFLDYVYTNMSQFDPRIKFLVIGRCNNPINDKRIRYTGYLESVKDYVAALSSLDDVFEVDDTADPAPYTKILEAMSCSLPVFTTPPSLVGIEQAKPGRDILVFEKEQLISKVNQLIFDDSLMEEVGQNARATVDKYYSKRANEQKLIQIIENLSWGKKEVS